MKFFNAPFAILTAGVAGFGFVGNVAAATIAASGCSYSAGLHGSIGSSPRRHRDGSGGFVHVV